MGGNERDLEQLIDAIYDSALEPEWDGELVRALNKRFSSHSLVMHVINTRTDEIERIVTNVPTEIMRSYAEEHYQSDLWLQGGLVHAHGRARRGEDYVRDSDLKRTGFYAKSLAPIDAHHLLAETMTVGSERRLTIGLHHDARQGSFDAAQLRELENLAPHLARSERLRQRLRDTQRMAQVGLSSLHLLPHDVVICDKAGRVVFANKAAEERNSRGDGLRFHSSFGASAEAVLTASDPATTSKLLRAVATAATRGAGHERGATLRLPRRESPIALIAIVIALPRSIGAGTPLAMILLSDPLAVDPGYQQRAQAAFALTPAEARLADALVRGLSRAEFAQAVRVKPSTVKTQMKALLAKTDTHRESELLRLLLAVPRLAPAR